MSQTARFALLVALALALFAPTGCSKPGMDAETVAMHRTRLSLAEEPDGIQTVSDVRSTLLGVDPTGHNHDDHDHDGDGQPDHAPEDHAAAHDADGQEHGVVAQAGHDANGDKQGDADGDDHVGPEEHAQSDEAADDHDHDGDGQPDHAPQDHVHATEPQLVNIVGHIGGLANPWANVHKEYPFAKSQAVLFLADPQAVIENEEAGHVHAPGEECAFCAAHAADKADMIALVQFVDNRGKVLPVDIRDLFDVQERDTVVVQGEARVTEGGILVVNAQGLYIRK